MVKSHMSKVRKARRIQRRVRRVGASSISATERELMTLAGLEVQEGELRLFPGWDEEVSETLAATKAAGEDSRPRLVDTTMLYAPRSGGVKRYLLSKKAWLEARPATTASSSFTPPNCPSATATAGPLR
jgi:alpha-1,6-mannosyltransferase